MPRLGDEAGTTEGEGLAALIGGPPRGAAGTPGQRPHVVWQ